MRRGAYLESRVNEILEILRTHGIFGQKSHAERSHAGQYRKGEAFDYLVISHGRMVCFDAKECHEPHWNLKKNAKQSQVENLSLCKRNGADAFFLVFFVLENRLVKFDVDLVIEAQAHNMKSLQSKHGEPWNWEELLKEVA